MSSFVTAKKYSECRTGGKTLLRFVMQSNCALNSENPSINLCHAKDCIWRQFDALYKSIQVVQEVQRRPGREEVRDDDRIGRETTIKSPEMVKNHFKNV